MTELIKTLAAIDEANAGDPHRLGDRPLALVQGESASNWLKDLAPDPSNELVLAVRAHHLRRWELARSDFPQGRNGYLRWRRENKAHQAQSLADIMASHRWSAESIERARTLLGRTRLRSDSETQTLEDVACLVFLETAFDDMTSRLDHDHLVSVVVKTLAKMSPEAISLAGRVNLSTPAVQVLADAVAITESQ